MLISPDYCALNTQLHTSNPEYGSHGHKWAEKITRILKACGGATVLDYGAGKRTLEKALVGITVTSYDPAVPEIAARLAGRFDVVVCTDVLEHVEPDCINDVLADIAALTGRIAFLVAATRPAVKTLADGRNAHILQRAPNWWGVKIGQTFQGFKLRACNYRPGEVDFQMERTA